MTSVSSTIRHSLFVIWSGQAKCRRAQEKVEQILWNSLVLFLSRVFQPRAFLRPDPSRPDQLRARNRLFNHRNDSHPDPSGIQLSELIRVKLPPQGDCKTDVSSDSSSSQRTSLSRNAAPQFVLNLNPSFLILAAATTAAKRSYLAIMFSNCSPL